MLNEAGEKKNMSSFFVLGVRRKMGYNIACTITVIIIRMPRGGTYIGTT